MRRRYTSRRNPLGGQLAPELAGCTAPRRRRCYIQQALGVLGAGAGCWCRVTADASNRVRLATGNARAGQPWLTPMLSIGLDAGAGAAGETLRPDTDRKRERRAQAGLPRMARYSLVVPGKRRSRASIGSSMRRGGLGVTFSGSDED